MGKQQPDLNGADFHSANASLAFTNLRGTDLFGANLSGTSLYEAIVDLARQRAHVTLDSKTRFGDIDW